MIEINLLPGAPRKTKGRSSAFATSAALAGVGAWFKDSYLLGGVGAAAIGLAAITGMYVYQGRREHAVTERETTAVRDSARFSAVLVARKRAQADRDSVYQQLAIIKSIDDSRYTWPHLLEEINQALPPYTWLTSVEQTSTVQTTASFVTDTTAAARTKADSLRKVEAKNPEAAKHRRAHADSLFNGSGMTIKFRIIGQTADIQALTRFMKSLEISPFIKNVQLTRSDLVTTGSQPVTEFQLEAESEVPPASVLRTTPLSLAVR